MSWKFRKEWGIQREYWEKLICETSQGIAVLAKLCSSYVTMKPSREFNGKETKLCKNLQRIPF